MIKRDYAIQNAKARGRVEKKGFDNTIAIKGLMSCKRVQELQPSIEQKFIDTKVAYL